MTTPAKLLLPLAAAAFPAIAQPTVFAWDQNDQTISVVSPSRVTSTEFRAQAGFSQAPEMEYMDGVLYLSQTGTSRTTIRRFDADTGVELTPLALTYPGFLPDDVVITAMEAADGVLWGALARQGGVTFDMPLVSIDTATGQILYQGPTTITEPITGLAWDGADMFAVAGGMQGSPLRLYTVDLIGAQASTVGDITVPGIPALQITALEFAPSQGPLLALANISGGNSGQLFVLSPVTAQGLRLGDTGETGLVALTTRECDDAGDACSPADLVEPFGTLNFNDVIAYLNLFAAGCP